MGASSGLDWAVQRTTPVAKTGSTASGTLSGDGDVVKWFNTEVCKTSIHRFESGRRLHIPDDPVS
jgi:hypothetical protein